MSIFSERSFNQDLPPTSIPSDIWSSGILSLFTLGDWLCCFGLLGFLHHLSFSRLHSLRTELGSDHWGALYQLGRVLQMERSLQLDSRRLHPSPAHTNGVAFKGFGQAET